jgi:hypothetical protein
MRAASLPPSYTIIRDTTDTTRTSFFVQLIGLRENDLRRSAVEPNLTRDTNLFAP